MVVDIDCHSYLSREFEEVGRLQNHAVHDPIQPWLSLIQKYVHEFRESNGSNLSQLIKVLEEAISRFQEVDRYLDDMRFLKIWVIYADVIQDFKKVYEMMNEKGIGKAHSFLYEAYAVHLELMGRWDEAHTVYRLGISRNAKPLERLKKMHKLFLERAAEANISLANEVEAGSLIEHGGVGGTNPWAQSTITELLEKTKKDMHNYEGCYRSAKSYPGKLPSSSGNLSRNMIVELGRKKYQIKGCSGKGGYAQVFKSHVYGSPEETVALKIQNPAFPWEFYMYKQLDEKIPAVERSNFGFAQKIHIYADCSILVCDYVENGTLQDVVNSYVVTGHAMDEVTCIYYTIEMLRMIETLHRVGIIHGDFKPDNLLVRNACEVLEVEDFFSRSGPWKDQGLCLVDWGRGINLRLFPDGTEFVADCRTSGFRCIEMQEGRSWVFQGDTYGLCAIVHMMLHGKYMEVEKKASPQGSYRYLPRLSFKRYWNVDLWKSLFSELLNIGSSEDTTVLRNLREKFENYFRENPHFIKKLIQLLGRQRTVMCSSR
ncbi:unnamed protein product [Victoria cruziana]